MLPHSIPQTTYKTAFPRGQTPSLRSSNLFLSSTSRPRESSCFSSFCWVFKWHWKSVLLLRGARGAFPQHCSCSHPDPGGKGCTWLWFFFFPAAAVWGAQMQSQWWGQALLRALTAKLSLVTVPAHQDVLPLPKARKCRAASVLAFCMGQTKLRVKSGHIPIADGIAWMQQPFGTLSPSVFMTWAKEML